MTELTLPSTVNTPEMWEQTLRERALQLGLDHLDILFDQSGVAYSGMERRPLMYPLQVLLQDTAHDAAASEGPVLFRCPLTPSTPCAGLLHLAQRFVGQPKLLVLLSPWDFSLLAAHCRHYLLAAWDDGKKQGVLRYYDPRVFRPVVQQLEKATRAHLLSAAYEWHWIDRDQQPAQLLAQTAPDAPWTPAPTPALTLRQSDLDVLSSWHQAELWRQERLLTPGECGQPSQEAMMDTLAQLQMDADRQQLLSQPAREAFIQQQLGATPG